jgi:hypothetical protein
VQHGLFHDKEIIMRTRFDSSTLKILGGVVVAAGAVALGASCGGGGGGDDEELPTAIDMASVTAFVQDLDGLVPVCQVGATGRMQSARVFKLLPALAGSSARTKGVLAAGATKRHLALTATPPADSLGDCGGRFGYRNYSHVNGVTTATLAFESYCMTDSASGDKVTVNGGVAFVNTATVTAGGPITTRLEAHTSTALSVATRDANGTALDSATMAFDGFEMVFGVPGGDPTPANPNVLRLREMTMTNGANGKTYRETNWEMRQVNNAATGTSEFTLGGRGYRSNGQYFDIFTDEPLVQNDSGDLLGGKLRFAGSNGSNAVATVVPGPILQVTMTINGTPLTSVPVCAVE